MNFYLRYFILLAFMYSCSSANNQPNVKNEAPVFDCNSERQKLKIIFDSIVVMPYEQSTDLSSFENSMYGNRLKLLEDVHKKISALICDSIPDFNFEHTFIQAKNRLISQYELALKYQFCKSPTVNITVRKDEDFNPIASASIKNNCNKVITSLKFYANFGNGKDNEYCFKTVIIKTQISPSDTKEIQAQFSKMPTCPNSENPTVSLIEYLFDDGSSQLTEDGIYLQVKQSMYNLK